jgi:DNA-binding response OmpR family regulator
LEKIQKFLGDTGVLIISANQNTKTSLKKIFTEYGVASTKVYSAENVENAHTLIEHSQAKLIILDAQLNGKSTRDLIEGFVQKNPLPLNRVICLMDNEDSEIFKLEKLEYEYDHLFVAPFTYNAFKNNIEKIIISKTKIGEFEKTLLKMKLKLEAEDFDTVTEFIQKFDDKGIDDSRFELFRATYKYKVGLFEESIKILDEIIAKEPDNYKALTKLFDIYMELNEYDKAHDLSVKYLEHYAFHPKRIEPYIKCTLISKNYNEVLSYGLKVEPFMGLGEKTYNALAAGMIIASNQLSEHNPELSIEAATRALKFSDFKANKVAALNVLVKCKESAMVRRYIEELEEHERDNQIKIVELRALDLDESPKNIYAKSLELIQEGIVDFSVYDICIRAALNIGRKRESIMEQVEDASNHFPERKEYFASFVS